MKSSFLSRPLFSGVVFVVVIFCCFLLSHGDEPCCNQCNRVTRLVIFFFLYETLLFFKIFVRHRHNNNNNNKKNSKKFPYAQLYSYIYIGWSCRPSPVVKTAPTELPGHGKHPERRKSEQYVKKKKARSISQFCYLKFLLPMERGGGSATTTTTTQASSHPISRNSSASLPHKKTNAVLTV